MVNLSSLAAATTTATALSNLILVSPQAVIGYQPQNPQSSDGTTSQNPPALLFHYEGEQSVALTSDITDHFVEDNTTIQDQIALRPEIITTQGFIGELNDVAPKVLAPLKVIADKLTVVDAYTPALSTTALIAYNEAVLAYSLAQNVSNSATAAWSSINNGNPNVQTKQQVMFQQFYSYQKNRTLFTVQTPWAVFNNMAIQSLRAVQDADTRMITTFEVTFKAMRFASTIVANNQADPANFQGRSAQQAAGVTDLGTSTPVSSVSLTSKLGN